MENSFIDTSPVFTQQVNIGPEKGLLRMKEGIVETIRGMDAYQLLGLMIAFVALFTAFRFFGAGISEASGGYGASGGGEILLAFFWMMLGIGGLSMISGQLDLEGVRSMVEQNHAAIIGLLVAFVLGATLVEMLAVKTLMQ